LWKIHRIIDEQWTDYRKHIERHLTTQNTISSSRQKLHDLQSRFLNAYPLDPLPHSSIPLNSSKPELPLWVCMKSCIHRLRQYTQRNYMMALHLMQPVYFLLNMGSSTTCRDSDNNTWLHILCHSSVYWLHPDFFRCMIERSITVYQCPWSLHALDEGLPLFVWIVCTRNEDNQTPMDCLRTTWHMTEPQQRNYDHVSSCLQILYRACDGFPWAQHEIRKAWVTIHKETQK
jgi:hypothetical protein